MLVLLVLLVLWDIPAAELAQAACLRPRSFPSIRTGHRLPHPRTRTSLIRAAACFVRDWLQAGDLAPPTDDLAACPAYIDHLQRDP
ncbi:MAG: hypothetical protein M3R02_27550 [Chloroflexota bacterium]|nr:hypothetical protein [Chloroflexota bacterium]